MITSSLPDMTAAAQRPSALPICTRPESAAPYKSDRRAESVRRLHNVRVTLTNCRTRGELRAGMVPAAGGCSDESICRGRMRGCAQCACPRSVPLPRRRRMCARCRCSSSYWTEGPARGLRRTTAAPGFRPPAPSPPTRRAISKPSPKQQARRRHDRARFRRRFGARRARARPRDPHARHDDDGRQDASTSAPPTEAASARRLLPQAYCESMCAFVLLAGVERRVPAEARVLVHQIWLGDRRDDPTAANYSAEDLVLVQRDIGRLAQYTVEMGGGIDLLEIALKIPPWEPMRLLSRDELRGMKIDHRRRCRRKRVRARPRRLRRRLANGVRAPINDRSWAIARQCASARRSTRTPSADGRGRGHRQLRIELQPAARPARTTS